MTEERARSATEDTHAESPEWLEHLDHTADAGIVVRAGDEKELFARAAWGMFSVITDVTKVKESQSAEVSVEAADQEELLLRWLSELNFRHITRHEIYSRFEIRELTDKKLSAEVRGERTDPERHTIYTEIKAVTFHEMKIEQADGGWRAQIIFDL